MIIKLSEMLRYSLDSFEKEQVSLSEELNFIKTYLALEKRRLGNRLEIKFNIDDNLTIPVISGLGLTILNYFLPVL